MLKIIAYDYLNDGDNTLINFNNKNNQNDFLIFENLNRLDLIHGEYSNIDLNQFFIHYKIKN